MKRLAILRVALCAVAIFALANSARAQTATVGGRIVDPAEQVVGEVKVTALNIQTGATRQDVTDNTGLFRFSNLAPGPYALTIEKPGFKAIHIDDLVLTVNQIFTFEAHLELGAVVTSTIVKASDLPLIELENAQLSNLVDAKRINDLPLLTRDPYQLILLGPGVIQSNSPQGGFSVNGTSERNNNFFLDGADNNDTEVPGIAGGLNSLNPDSAQEFRVITNNFAPEYGRNNGAIVQVITRSGSNELHGSAYWFGRYNALGARDFFNPAATTGAQNPYVRNDFGASAGGPIIKDRTFWFVNYEGQRFVTTLNATSVVPTGDFKTGTFSALGQPIDVSAFDSANNNLGLPMDPTVQQMLALFPPANGPDVVPGMSGLLFFPSTSRFTSDMFTIRGDHKLTEKHQLTGRYSFNEYKDPNPLHTDFLPGGLGAFNQYTRTQNAVIGLTSTLTERLINEFRFGANRDDSQFGCVGISTFDSFGFVDPMGVGADFGMPFGAPSYLGFGCQQMGDANNQERFTGTYQTVDNMSYTRGHHQFKWGGEFRAIYSNSTANFSSRGLIDFQGYTNFGIEALTNIPADSPLFDPNNAGALASVEDAVQALLGSADFQQQAQFYNKNGDRTSTDLKGFRQREWGAFIQDTWKLKPNLTATYGVRWEYFGVPFEVNNNLTTLFSDPSGSAPFDFTTVGPGTGHTLYKNQYTNFEPRIGIAWDPWKQGRTSIRAGYGIYHDRLWGNLISNTRANPPFQQFFFGFPDTALSGMTAPDTLGTSSTLEDGTGFFAELIDPKLKMPYSQNWNIGVQQQLSANWTLEINYVGVKGNRILRTVDASPPQPNLVSQLLAFCVPGNAFFCDTSTLQFGNLYFGFIPGDPVDSVLPFNAVNNNAFYSGFGYGSYLFKSIGSSIYHGLQVNLQKRFANGFQLQAAYTYSHAISDVNDPLSPAAGNFPMPRNSFDLKAERGNSDFDVRDRAAVNFIYEPNIGRGREHLNSGFVGRLLEGWSLTGIVEAQTGHPFDVLVNVDSNHTGEWTRLTQIGGTGQPPGTDKTYTGPATGSFIITPFDVQPNTGKNEFYGPNLVNVDTAVLKNTALTEKVKLQFRLEVYNLFNHTQFAQPDNLYQDGALFGQSTTTITRPDLTTSARQLQVALKLLF
jgi:Carboxypeptidase regulatory-like domain/TonB dependent receptor